MQSTDYSLGIDIGSTTSKLVLINNGEIIYKKYKRHMSKVRLTTLEMLKEMISETGVENLSVTISGSAGMGLSEAAGIGFIQEVYATGEFVNKTAPDTSVVIELGGEDAKVIFVDKDIPNGSRLS